MLEIVQIYLGQFFFIFKPMSIPHQRSGSPTVPRATFPRRHFHARHFHARHFRAIFLCSLCKINTFVDLRFLGVWYGCEESCMWVHHRTILVPALGTHTRCVIAPTGQLARAESNSWYTAPAQLPGC